MKNLIKHGCITFVVCFLTSCEKIEIEQNVHKESLCNDKFTIHTGVYTYDYWGSFQTLEYYTCTYAYSDCLDSIKKIEYSKALPIYKKVKNCNNR